MSRTRHWTLGQSRPWQHNNIVWVLRQHWPHLLSYLTIPYTRGVVFSPLCLWPPNLIPMVIAIRLLQYFTLFTFPFTLSMLFSVKVTEYPVISVGYWIFTEIGTNILSCIYHVKFINPTDILLMFYRYISDLFLTDSYWYYYWYIPQTDIYWYINNNPLVLLY